MSVDVPASPAAVRSNPYVGPESFRRGDRLYGRDRAAPELLDLLVAERIVLLHSPSGAGKTSLIQARLLSELEDENFAVLPVVRLNHELPPEVDVRATQPPDPALPRAEVNRYVLSALMSLEEDLPRERQTPISQLATLTLAQYVARRIDAEDHRRSTVIIIDQFEEIITADPVDQPAKRTFFRQLGELLGDRTMWALLSMREDFLAELDPYARLVPTRFMNRYRLDLLTEAEALDAVIYPARDLGVDFDAAAAGKLVDDLRTVRVQRGSRMIEELGPYVEPVQLQVVCRGVWERKGESATRIGLADVEAVGNVDEALAAYYADCMSSAAQATGVHERALREWCEDALITPQGFRGQAMHGPQAAGASGEEVLDLLTAAHLLRAESRRGAVWFELAHDRLITPIKEDNEQWRRTNLSDVERRASLWDEQHRTDGLLLSGPELDEAEEWAASRSAELADVERDFLDASRRVREQAEKEARANARIRRWLVVAVVGFIVAVIASGLALASSRRAGEATLRASEAAVLGQALGNLNDDAQLSLRLAIKASALRDTASGALSDEAMRVLQRAVDASPVLMVMRGTESPAVDAIYSRDGTRIASFHEDLTLRLWDAGTGKLVWSARYGDGDPGPLAVAANGQRVAMGSQDGIRVWDVTSTSAPRQLLKGYAVDFLSFSPDGAWLVAHEFDPALMTEPEPGAAVPETEDSGRLVAVLLSSGVAKPLRGSAGWEPQWVGQGPWSAKGSRLITSQENSLQVRDTPTSEPRNVALPAPGATVAVSQNGKVVAIQENNGIRLFKGLNGTQMAWVNADQGPFGLSGDGRRLMIVDADNRLSLYDTAEGSLLRHVAQAGTFPGPAQLNPTNPDRALVVGTEGELTVWDVSTVNPEEQGVTAFDAEGDTGMTVTGTGVVRLWSSDARVTRTIDLPTRLSLPRMPVTISGQEDVEEGTYFSFADLSPTGTFLVVTADQPSKPSGSAYVVPLDPTRKPVRLEVPDPSHAINSLAVSRTGRYVVGGYFVATGGDLGGPGDEALDTPGVDEPPLDGAPAEGEQMESGMYVWDSATGKVVNRWASDLSGAFPVAVSPDEQEVLGFGQDEAVVWSLKTGTARLTIAPPSPQPSDRTTNRAQQPPSEGGMEEEGPELFTALAWSPDGKLIATAQRNDAMLWDSATGARVGTSFSKHSNYVTHVSFDPTGRRLVTVGQDGMVFVWDVATGEVTYEAKHAALFAQFVRAGRRLIVSDEQGLVSILWLDGRELLEAAKARTTRELTTAECVRYLGEEDICNTN